jgi:hypothetical protein
MPAGLIAKLAPVENTSALAMHRGLCRTSVVWTRACMLTRLRWGGTEILAFVAQARAYVSPAVATAGGSQQALLRAGADGVVRSAWRCVDTLWQLATATPRLTDELFCQVIKYTNLNGDRHAIPLPNTHREREA